MSQQRERHSSPGESEPRARIIAAFGSYGVTVTFDGEFVLVNSIRVRLSHFEHEFEETVAQVTAQLRASESSQEPRRDRPSSRVFDPHTDISGRHISEKSG
ncbi:MAG: hypothetical protein ACK5O2_12150 [Microthrixaceae bacterium]